MEVGYPAVADEIERALEDSSRSGQQAHLRRAALLLARMAGEPGYDPRRDRSMRRALEAAARLLPAPVEPPTGLVTRKARGPRR